MIFETTTAFFCDPATDCAGEMASDLSGTSTYAKDPSIHPLAPAAPRPPIAEAGRDGWACLLGLVSLLVSAARAGRLWVGEVV